MQIDSSKLDPLKAYLQITHVIPYFNSQELLQKTTSFELNDKICRFVFETPFTKSGKVHGSPAEQYMRKTILTGYLFLLYYILNLMFYSKTLVSLYQNQN